MSNKDNPIIGAEFQEQVRKWFEDHYDKPFVSEKKIAIGVCSDNKKDHKFDIVADDEMANILGIVTLQNLKTCLEKYWFVYMKTLSA